MAGSLQVAESLIEIPDYVRIGQTPDILSEGCTDLTVRLVIYQRELDCEIIEQLSQLVLTDEFENARRETCAHQKAYELSNSPSSLPKLKKQLQALCPGLEIIADEIFHNQMVPYFQNYPEIDTLDIETRLKKGDRDPVNGHFHADEQCYETHPTSARTFHGRSTECLYKTNVGNFRGHFFYASPEHLPLVHEIGTGNIGWMYAGKRTIFHRVPGLTGDERRIVTLVQPSKRSLRKLGIFVVG